MEKQDSSAIVLPVGDCGRIHIKDNLQDSGNGSNASSSSVRHQVENRKYITNDMICSVEGCPTTKQAVFSKNPKKRTPDLIGNNQLFTTEGAALIEHFVCEFNRATSEFADTEASKLSPQAIAKVTKNPPNKEYLDHIIWHFYGVSDESLLPNYRCDHDIVYALLAGDKGDDDMLTLMYLVSSGNIDMKAALSQYYGGQAVGHGVSFLFYHLLRFYIISNVIIACDYQTQHEKWGLLKSLMHDISKDKDCVFYTFIPCWREYLHPDVFMVDLTATMALLKKCFRILYILKFLLEKFDNPSARGYSNNGTVTYDDICRCFSLTNFERY